MRDHKQVRATMINRLCSLPISTRFYTSSSSRSDPCYRGLLLDIGGTLLETTCPVAETYASIGKKYGLQRTADEIKRGFKKAFAEPWPERLRYEGDGRPFWRFAVTLATGFDDNAYFEELYQHFAKGDAWRIAEGAPDVLKALRTAGVKVAVVSNFDSRLRGVLQELQIKNLFDAVIISSEVGYEKPAKEIFEVALSQLDLQPNEVVHVGDDLIADKQGANAIGIEAWLWKSDVKSFQDIAARIL